jgi:hypothetical protein
MFGNNQPHSGNLNLFNIWDEVGQKESAGTLQLVRLNADEVAAVPFTPQVKEVILHYSEEPEIRGYVQCNGSGCALCRAGRKPEERLLLPVYVPASRSIGVLPIGRSCRPGALLPQLMPALRSGKRIVLLISKPDRARYQVGSVELTDGMDDGAAQIEAFNKRWEAGEVDLASVYPRVENRELETIPGITTMLRLKGVDVGHG